MATPKPKPMEMPGDTARPHPADPPKKAKAASSGMYFRGGQTKRHAFYIDVDVLDRLRSADHWMPGAPEVPRGISALANEALRRYVEHLEDEYNRGKPFPPVPGK